MYYRLASVSVFPNPATESISVVLADQPRGNLSIKIYNSLGAEVHSIERAEATTHIDIKDLNPGMYLVKVNDAGEITNHRFIKR